MPANRMRAIAPNRHAAYEAMRKEGMPKQKAARIANAGRTKAGRSDMAKRGAETRKSSS